jgi:hypothetical protein
MEKAYLGRITAGMTHEINNVWATILEAAGLMKDLLATGQAVSSPLQERLVDVGERIGRQVERGVHLTDRLNQFAHSLDYPVRETDPEALVCLAVDLNQRFARLKKVELKKQPWSYPQRITLAPFHFLLVLSTCLTWLLDRTEPGGEIVLRPTTGSSDPTIEAQARPVSEPPAVMEERFQGMAHDLKAITTDTGLDLRKQVDSDRFSIHLALIPKVFQNVS